MLISTLLMAGKTVATAIQGANSKSSASKIAKIQQGIAKEDLMYNKDQLYDYANSAMTQTFSKYAQARADQFGEHNKMASEINTQASAQGVNLANSSLQGDMDARLDFEFETNMQNMLSNQVGELSSIISGASAQEYQLQRGYNSAITNINQAKLQVTKEANDKFYESLSNTMSSVAQGIGDVGAKNPTNTYKQNMGEYFTTFPGYGVGK
ncbi:MAG: hypothetical protein ACRC6A_06170 [Fusobacteriaceae bacterium]